MSVSARPPAAFVAGVTAACLFAVSLFLPVATAQQVQGLTTVGGFEILFIGPFGAIMGQFGWYATPCLVATIVMLIRRRPIGDRPPIILAAAMLVLLVDALCWSNYPNDGGDGPILRFGPGYFAWIAAVVVGAGGLLMARFGKGAS